MAQKTNITKDTPPEMIEQDIARTREEMSGTVNEIQERLSPTHLKEAAKGKIRETVRDATSRIGITARDAGSSILNVVKTYPVPVAMIGIGVTWLIFTRSSAGNGEIMEESTSALREKAGDITEKAQAKAEEWSGQVREKGSALAGRVKESAQRIGRTARESAWGAKDRIQQLIDDNPLGISLAAFGIGALMGFTIPESRKEVEMMGSASESLLSRAKETAQKTIQKAQHAAEKAVHTAEEEFKKTA